jgi:hypothetical protein
VSTGGDADGRLLVLVSVDHGDGPTLAQLHDRLTCPCLHQAVRERQRLVTFVGRRSQRDPRLVVTAEHDVNLGEYELVGLMGLVP